MKDRLIALTTFALAFALVEATVVVYLHQVLPIEEVRRLSQPPPPAILTLPFIAFLRTPGALFPDSWLLTVEQLREGATIVLLVAVAYLWGRSVLERMLAFVFAFSVWDLGYYLFLNRILGWPTSFWDIDVFFLVPVPWVGPVVLPIVLFSILFLVSGTLLLKKDSKRE